MTKIKIKDFFTQSLLKKVSIVFIIFFFSQMTYEIYQYFSNTKLLEENFITARKVEIKNQVDQFIDYMKNKHQVKKNEQEEKIKSDVEHVDQYLTLMARFLSWKKKQGRIIDFFKSNHPEKNYFIYNTKGSLNLTGEKLPPLYLSQILRRTKEYPGRICKISLENGSNFHGLYNNKLGIIIGLIQSDNELIEELKQEILSDMEKINFEHFGYIFIDTYDFYCVRHIQPKYIGKNVFHNQDAKGFYVNQELYRMGREKDGGFLEYYDTTGNIGRKTTKKYTYVSTYKPFEWTIGSGIYTEDLEKRISMEKKTLKADLITQIIFFIVFFFILFFLAVSISFSIMEKIKHDFSFLITKTRKAISDNSEIDFDDLNFIEISEFAISINYILKQWRKNQKNYRETENRLRTLINAIPDFIILKDTKNTWIEANKTARNLFKLDNYAYKGLTNKEISQFTSSNTNKLKEFEDLEKKIIHDGNIHRQEFSLEISGQRKIMDIIWIPILNEEKKHNGMAIIARDITDLRKLSEEMIHLVRLDSIGLIAGGIAHDFNNTLMVIQGNLSLLENNKQSAKTETSKILSHIKNSINKGRFLANYLLTYSKGGKPVKRNINIVKIFKESMSFALAGSNIKENFTTQYNNIIILGDENQLLQVFSSLIYNSIQAMPNGGDLKCSIRVKKNFVQALVEDHGHGIPPKNLNKIFDPFFTTREKSLGLGLATSYSIIKRHKGMINIQSEEAKGTIVEVLLPYQSYDNIQERKPQNSQNLKILVMDDDKDILNVIYEYLTNLKHKVSLSTKGEEAIDKYKKALDMEKPYDLVILDLTIAGGMGGKECVRRLIKIHPKVKAVASSGYSNDEVMSRYKEFGFIDVLPKPYTLEMINHVIHNLQVDKS